MGNSNPLWKPTDEHIRQTLLWSFMAEVSRRTRTPMDDYETLYRWSVTDKERFWSTLWDFCGVIGHKGEHILENGSDIEHARWFPGATLNFAENLLRARQDGPAIFSKVENEPVRELSYNQLYDQVAALASWLREVGVQRGDRVAGFLPNIPEAITAMLATTSLGAVWTSTSPDFGTESVLERFGQTEPKVLFATDGYYYNGKLIDCRPKIAEISKSIASIEHTVIISLTGAPGALPGIPFNELVESPHNGVIEFEPCGFNDPLYILYSSGTTGKPKCITHKVGGTLLQHLKEHQLQSDIRPRDRVFYFTTCGWMMWNWLASVLASRATAVLYDGSPFYPDGNILWDYADEVQVSLFGTSAKYLDSLKKNGTEPVKKYRLEQLRTICSTGSVLAPESFDYVYHSIKSDVCLSSISGGTDIVSCFALGCPILPVYRGEIQCRGLGMAVEVFDQAGTAVIEEKGELVCTATFPSQPACFWADPDGKKYHKAYFAKFSNVWHHGDFVKLTNHGSMVIYGRSDATLNPSGVRIGTAEIYRYVEQIDEVVESIIIGQEWQSDTRLVLFVVLRPALSLTEELTGKICRTLREKCSPRHVPQKVIAVAEIPRTKSGKIVELAVREVVHGQEVNNISALANPETLDYFKNIPELQT